MPPAIRIPHRCPACTGNGNDRRGMAARGRVGAGWGDGVAVRAGRRARPV